jgi:hydroxymethylbilane synthase
VPIGALAVLEGDSLKLDGMVGSLDGTVVFRESINGDMNEAESLGTRLADSLIEMGARELLDQTREKVAASDKVG